MGSVGSHVSLDSSGVVSKVDGKVDGEVDGEVDSEVDAEVDAEVDGEVDFSVAGDGNAVEVALGKVTVILPLDLKTKQWLSFT